MNNVLFKHFSERGSVRGAHRLFGLSRTTIGRKVKFLGKQSTIEHKEMNELLEKVSRIQFDDLETAEHSTCKPVAISLAVVSDTRWILGFEASSMPVKWKLRGEKLLKYGNRKDMRAGARSKLFTRIKGFLREDVEISSDRHPHYSKSIRAHFPKAKHIQYESREPRDQGQDELKKGRDPLFSLNHTCAMLRDRMARLTRKSWCLSKKREHLLWHLAIYAVAHNKNLDVWKEISARQ